MSRLQKRENQSSKKSVLLPSLWSSIYGDLRALPAHELMESPKSVLLPHVQEEDRRKEVDALRVANLHEWPPKNIKRELFMDACAFSEMGVSQGEGEGVRKNGEGI
jgi:hypothetical protein